MNIGQIVECWNPEIYDENGKRIFEVSKENTLGWKKAEIINIRTNVKSSFDNYIYSVLYDVFFIKEKRFSKGHFPTSLRYCVERGDN